MSALRALVEELEKEELPGNIDPEKDDSETAAVTENNDRRHYEEVSKSKLKPIAQLDSGKYAGKKVSRDELEAESDDDYDGDSEENSEDENEEIEIMSKLNKKRDNCSQEIEEEEDLTGLIAVEAGSDEEFDDEEESGTEDNDNDDEVSSYSKEKDVLGNQIDDEDEILSDEAGELDGGLDDLPIFNREKKSEQKSETEIGKGVILQYELYDQLVQARIRLQKLLATAAQLPSPDNIETFNRESSEDSNNVYLRVKRKIEETGQIMGSIYGLISDKTENTRKRKYEITCKSSEDWNEFSEKRKRIFSSTWESVKHGSSGQDPNVAVNSILSDPDRLLRRCQLKKSFPNRRLGQDKEKIEQLDSEQYDDTGLYQAILRNLINSKVKVGGENRNEELNRHWLKLQRMERKSKKAAVDTKASKGRKIRYNVNPKLVGFFPKIDSATWSHQKRNQLFRGVFQ